MSNFKSCELTVWFALNILAVILMGYRRVPSFCFTRLYKVTSDNFLRFSKCLKKSKCHGSEK
jgi:hypothetical protein